MKVTLEFGNEDDYAKAIEIINAPSIERRVGEILDRLELLEAGFLNGTVTRDAFAIARQDVKAMFGEYNL